MPTEFEFTELFGVSRGTIRKAIEELVRSGLLHATAGRGTFVDKRVQVRRLVSERLAAVAVPDSRFDLDVLQFVPDFAGSASAVARVRNLKWYRDARTVFVAPDNSLERLRAQALDDGKIVIVPTYGMRRGMIRLDPRSVRSEHRTTAATLDGMERYGRCLGIDELSRLRRIDFMITGATAVGSDGLHVGGGQAYLDLEWGILAELDLVDESTPVAAVVHPYQLIETAIPPGPFDLTVDLIALPDRTIRTHREHPRPAGLAWEAITFDLRNNVAYLADIDDRTTDRIQRTT